jgi:hypothetical protein
MRRDLLFASLLAGCAVLAGCKPRENGAGAAPPGKPVWHCTVETDAARNTTVFYAWLLSSNAPVLKYPYRGAAPVRLLLSKHKGDAYRDSTAPVLVLANGRFHCVGGALAGSCRVTMTVDGGAPQTVNAFDAACPPNRCLMISMPAETGRRPDGEPLIERLRTARTVVLDLPLEQHGDFSYRFDTAGLKWSRETDRQ